MDKTCEMCADGKCCNNCRYHIQDFYHCTTKRPLSEDGLSYVGGCVCSIPKGWICMNPEMEGRVYSGWTEHGLCECWMPKNNPELIPGNPNAVR